MDKRVTERIRYADYLHRITTAEKASAYIQDGMTVGLSGFTRAGEAKAVSLACIERARKEPFKLTYTREPLSVLALMSSWLKWEWFIKGFPFKRTEPCEKNK